MEYITSEGEAWDFIAKKVYGKEHLAYILMEANPEYLNYSTLPAGIKLYVPEVQASQTVEVAPWQR